MKPHATDFVSLTFGAAFLAIAALWLATRYVSLTWPTLGWLVVAALASAGVAGVALALRRSRRQPEADRSQPPRQ